MALVTGATLPQGRQEGHGDKNMQKYLIAVPAATACALQHSWHGGNGRTKELGKSQELV